ncbi:MAG: SufE family protein [Isosphaeraceae bacterium]
MAESLHELIEELSSADRQERIELLIDLARILPALPERYLAARNSDHRVEECQSPVYLFVEVDEAGLAHLFADVPVEAPTVRGFVSLLVESLNARPVEAILAVPDDLVVRTGVQEILGMQRVSGLNGVLRRLKRMAHQSIASGHSSPKT